MRGGHLVHTADARGRRGAQGGPLRVPPRGRREALSGGGPHRVVGVALDPAVLGPAGVHAGAGGRGECGGDDRGVGIDPPEVDHPTRGGAVELRARGRAALGEVPLVPAVTEHPSACGKAARIGSNPAGSACTAT